MESGSIESNLNRFKLTRIAIFSILPNMKKIFFHLIIYFAVLPSIIRSQVSAFDKNRAFSDLERQCAFGPRFPGSKGHDDCLAFLSAELSKNADKAIQQAFTGLDALRNRNFRMVNVIASFTRRGRRLLLCAHWDTRVYADSDPDPKNRMKPVPGANDGASGVAVLLEIARILKQHPPPRGVDIVLFDGEDNGVELQYDTWCVGSRHFAARKRPEYRPQYAILLDMIGDKNLFVPVENNSQKYAPQIVEKVWSKARVLGFSAFDKRVGYEVVDDHLELLKAGIPAVDLIDLDYSYWHTSQDTPDQCSPESLWTVGTLLLHLIYE